MMSPERSLIWFLRLTAIVLMSAMFAVVIPYSWMNVTSEALDLGTLPDRPLVGYLTRSISALYAACGMYCWYLSRDVRRYLPLLRFAVPLTVVFTVVLVLIDFQVEMPFVWVVGEGAFLVVWAIVLWWLVGRVTSADS